MRSQEKFRRINNIDKIKDGQTMSNTTSNLELPDITMEKNSNYIDIKRAYKHTRYCYEHYTNPNQRNCRSCVRCRLGQKMYTDARRASWSVCVRERPHRCVRGAAPLLRDQCAPSTRPAQRAPSQPCASWKLCRVTKVLTTR